MRFFFGGPGWKAQIPARLTKIEAEVRVVPGQALGAADTERDAAFAETDSQHVTRALDDVDLR